MLQICSFSVKRAVCASQKTEGFNLFLSLLLLFQGVGVLLNLLLEGFDLLQLFVAFFAQFGDLLLSAGAGPFEGNQVVEDHDDEPEQGDAETYLQESARKFLFDDVVEEIPDYPDDGCG